VDVQEVRKLDAYLKRLFGNARIRVVPREEDSANVFVGEENVGQLRLDDDDDDDDRSYNFEMKITVGDAPAKVPISRSWMPISAQVRQRGASASCRA